MLDSKSKFKYFIWIPGLIFMLSKFVLTALVITIAFFVIRQRHLSGNDVGKRKLTISQETEKNYSKNEFKSDLRFGAYIFLTLMVGLGASLYYFDWLDNHTILTVNLHRDNLSQPISYEVYKYQLEDRSFITTDGRTITVASNERMEILGLYD